MRTQKCMNLLPVRLDPIMLDRDDIEPPSAEIDRAKNSEL